MLFPYPSSLTIKQGKGGVTLAGLSFPFRMNCRWAARGSRRRWWVRTRSVSLARGCSCRALARRARLAQLEPPKPPQSELPGGSLASINAWLGRENAKTQLCGFFNNPFPPEPPKGRNRASDFFVTSLACSQFSGIGQPTLLGMHAAHNAAATETSQQRTVASRLLDPDKIRRLRGEECHVDLLS